METVPVAETVVVSALTDVVVSEPVSEVLSDDVLTAEVVVPLVVVLVGPALDSVEPVVDVTVPDALPDVVTVVPLVVVLVGPALVCVALVEDTVALLVTVTVSVLVWVVADVEQR